MDKNIKTRIAFNVAIIASIFVLLVSILLLLNYFQLSSTNPIESETLKVLIERLNSDPNNTQLLQEIRSFDLMARKAYFTSKWQIETGGFLLIISSLILIISLRYYFSENFKIEKPEESKLSENATRFLTSKWILGIGVAFIIIVLITSFLSVNQLDKYNPATTTVTSLSPEENIEVVDITNPVNQDVAVVDTNGTNLKDTTSAIKAEEAPTLIIPSLAEIKKQSNSFRGPLGQGVFPVKDIPEAWDVIAGTNIKWKVKVPKKGYNSPVIWGNNIFITSSDINERFIYCYDSKSGKLKWQHKADNIEGSPATPPKTTDDTGLAAPSVTTDGYYVVAIFGTGDIIACDNSGKRIWAKNLGVPANHYGHSSSLNYWNGKVIVQFDTSKGGRLLSLNISSGEIIWDTKRTSHISWASPILAEINGKMQIITSSEPSVAGYDAETGKELWKNDCMMGEVGPSPAFGSGLIFATNEYATLAAINPSDGSIAWQGNEYLPEVASPVVYQGLLFISTSYGILACYDAKTGSKHWEKDFGEGFYSSPVIADGKLFAVDMKGVVHIMKASEQAETIGDIPTGEKVMATPSFSNGCVYIRGAENLYCIGK